jgi:NitT/TauT family transport system substrate-binding protein
VFANEEWLAQEGNEEIAVKFLRASFRGWTYCRDNAADCVGYVLAEGSTLGAGHQAWMMNEINKLIWPSANGIGQLDMDQYQQTADIALNYEVITAAPDEGAVRTDLAATALSGLQADYPDVDFTGENYTPETVEITANGE